MASHWCSSVVLLLSFHCAVTRGEYCFISYSYTYCSYGCCTNNHCPYNEYCSTDDSRNDAVVTVNSVTIVGSVVTGAIMIMAVTAAICLYSKKKTQKKKTTVKRVKLAPSHPDQATSTFVPCFTDASGGYPMGAMMLEEYYPPGYTDYA